MNDILLNLLDERKISHQIRNNGKNKIIIIRNYDYGFLQELYELGFEFEQKFQEVETNKIEKWLEVKLGEE